MAKSKACGASLPACVILTSGICYLISNFACLLCPCNLQPGNCKLGASRPEIRFPDARILHHLLAPAGQGNPSDFEDVGPGANLQRHPSILLDLTDPPPPLTLVRNVGSIPRNLLFPGLEHSTVRKMTALLAGGPTCVCERIGRDVDSSALQMRPYTLLRV